MSLIDNIKESFNGLEIYKPLYRVLIIGEDVGYFEGVLGIKSFAPDQIALFIKKGELIVKGENLYVKSFCEGDLAISGKILSVERK